MIQMMSSICQIRLLSRGGWPDKKGPNPELSDAGKRRKHGDRPAVRSRHWPRPGSLSQQHNVWKRLHNGKADFKDLLTSSWVWVRAVAERQRRDAGDFLWNVSLRNIKHCRNSCCFIWVTVFRLFADDVSPFWKLPPTQLETHALASVCCSLPVSIGLKCSKRRTWSFFFFF